MEEQVRAMPMTAESGFLTDPMIQTPDERLPPKRSKRVLKKGWF